MSRLSKCLCHVRTFGGLVEKSKILIDLSPVERSPVVNGW